jgi:hypothetical protein
MSNFLTPKSIWIGKLCYACIRLDRNVKGADLMLPVKIIDFIPGSLDLVSVLLPGDSQRWIPTRDLFDHIEGKIVELRPTQSEWWIKTATYSDFANTPEKPLKADDACDQSSSATPAEKPGRSDAEAGPHSSGDDPSSPDRFAGR